MNIVKTNDKRYVLGRVIDPSWIAEYGEDKLLEFYGADKLVKPPDGKTYVANEISDAVYEEIIKEEKENENISQSISN